MHPIVPIIMSLGAIVFFIGIIVFAKFGLQQIKQVKFFGKEHKLWRFTATTVGSGVLLILLSIIIHKSIPYTPETSEQILPVQSARSDFEQELVLSDITSDAMVAYVKNFQLEYQTALEKGDEATAQLLRLELQFRLRTELENKGLEGSQIEREVSRIMARLPQGGK